MAANPLKGEIDLVAGDETYTLVFTSNAIVQVEQLLSASIGEITGRLTHVENIRVLLWAALQKHHGKTVDLMKAGDILDAFDGGMNGIADPLARALRFRLARTPIEQPL
jgi:hypothetical protein